MTVVREAIFQTIDDRLGTLGYPEYERMPSSDPASFPALHVFDGGQEPVRGEPWSTTYDLTFTVEGYVEGGGGVDAHAALHDLYAVTVAALIIDPPLGGLVETIDEGSLRIDVATLASVRRLAFSLDFGVTFFSSRSDPAQAA